MKTATRILSCLAVLLTWLAVPTTVHSQIGNVIDFIEEDSFFTFWTSNQNSHLRIEHVRVPDTNEYDLHISSSTGPIRHINLMTGTTTTSSETIAFSNAFGLTINTHLSIISGNGHDVVELIGTGRVGNIFMDWITVDVSTDSGDDEVNCDGLLAYQTRITTGRGNDLVSLLDCSGHPFFSMYSELEIDTGNGDDQVFMRDRNQFLSIGIELGSGDDQLIGDPHGQIPELAWISARGGRGWDAVIHRNYFRYLPWTFSDFEVID